MPGRPRRAPRQEPLTTVEQMLDPITSLAPLVTRQFVREILAAPVPSWPSRFPCDWGPTPGGPVYEIAVETARMPLRPRGNLLDDPRSITMRVEGSPDRRVNDWEGFSIRWSGTALHRSAIVLADLGAPILPLVGGLTWVVLWIRTVELFHDDVSTAHGYMNWALARPEYHVVPDGPSPPTDSDSKLIERGYKLLKRFTTTMTARGKPGSGISQDQRRTDARHRLTDAGHELLHDDPPSPISATYLVSALRITGRAVYLMLERAGWEIEDVQEAANSVHMGCRNGR